METIANLLLWLVSSLPLGISYRIMDGIAFLANHMAKGTTRMIEENLAKTPFVKDDKEMAQMRAGVCRELLRSGVDFAWALKKDIPTAMARFDEFEGVDELKKAIAEKKSILMVTPHLGSFDLAGRYVSTLIDSTVNPMFKPSNLKFINGIMAKGRERGNSEVAPANMVGVKMVVKAMREGRMAIILPDQVPVQNDGVWVEFFGEKAYTMTLVPKLGKRPNVATFFFAGIRKGRDGKKIRLVVRPYKKEWTGDLETDARNMNEEVEKLIALAPEQYLFTYNRYREPRPQA